MTHQTRRPAVLAGLISLAVILVLPLAAATASGSFTSAPASRTAPPVRLPAHPDGLAAPGQLGNVIDDQPDYQPQLGCAVTAMPGTVKLRALALATYGRGGTSPATPRSCASGSASEHKDGRAWDWMLSYADRADRAVAADFLSWLTGNGPSGEPGEMAARLGVMYVIYNHKIWAAYSPGWRDYTGADPHTSHVHISLTWNGARAHTSFWTGRAWATDYGTCPVFANQPAVVVMPRPHTQPCPEPAMVPRGSSKPLGWLGSTGAYLARGQQRLGVPVTNTFDTVTRNAVLAYQRNHDLPANGTLDDPTWASLVPLTVQRNVPAWTAAKAVAWARRNGSPGLRRGAAGEAVFALQVALGLDRATRNGFFRPLTAAQVIAFKQSHGLPANAVVDDAVWAAFAS